MSLRGAARWPVLGRRFAWAAVVSVALHTALLAVIEAPDPAPMAPSAWPRVEVKFAMLAPAVAPVAKPQAVPSPIVHPDVMVLPAATAGTPRGGGAQKTVSKPRGAKSTPRVAPRARRVQKRPRRAPAVVATASAPLPDPPSPDGEDLALSGSDSPAAGLAPGGTAQSDAASAFPAKLELEYSIREAGDDDATVLGWMVHRFERDGDRYRIRSSIDAVGVVSLFVKGRYVQQSEGRLTAAGLRPERFMVRRGRRERVERARFDWPALRATLTGEQGSREWVLEAGAQDQLSLVHQIAYLLDQQALPRILVTNGRRFETARIEIVGRETVNTGLGPMETVRIRADLERGAGFEIWLAPDFGHLAVRLRLRDKRGREADQLLANMKVKW